MRVPTSTLFNNCYSKYGIAAVNVFCAEQIHGLFRSAQKARAPFIVQLTPVARNYAHPEMLSAMIEAAGRIYPETIYSVHLDHGTPEHCRDAIRSGHYDSVMIDASHENFHTNIEITSGIVEQAHSAGITVEAELGVLSGMEDDKSVDDYRANYTDPGEAVAFVNETGCDSLAIAVGTSHGAYKFSGKGGLQFNILEEISNRLPGFPLVLHGASAVPMEEVDRINQAGGSLSAKAKGVDNVSLMKAIKMGVCKINIATDTRLIWARVHREFFKNSPELFDLVIPGTEYMKAYEDFMIGKFELLDAPGKAETLKVK
jgi:fructose-bisphosphate aldolase class II